MINDSTGKKKTVIVWIVFIIYIAVLCYLLLFSGAFRAMELPEGYSRVNLMPLREILREIHRVRNLGLIYLIRNLVGNVVGFIPFGLILPYLMKKAASWWKVTLMGLGFSLTIEILQYVFRVGVFDVDDIILNTLGTFIGYCIFKAVSGALKGRVNK